MESMSRADLTINLVDIASDVVWKSTLQASRDVAAANQAVELWLLSHCSAGSESLCPPLFPSDLWKYVANDQRSRCIYEYTSQ